MRALLAWPALVGLVFAARCAAREGPRVDAPSDLDAALSDAGGRTRGDDAAAPDAGLAPLPRRTLRSPTLAVARDGSVLGGYIADHVVLFRVAEDALTAIPPPSALSKTAREVEWVTSASSSVLRWEDAGAVRFASRDDGAWSDLPAVGAASTADEHIVSGGRRLVRVRRRGGVALPTGTIRYGESATTYALDEAWTPFGDVALPSRSSEQPQWVLRDGACNGDACAFLTTSVLAWKRGAGAWRTSPAPGVPPTACVHARVAVGADGIPLVAFTAVAPVSYTPPACPTVGALGVRRLDLTRDKRGEMVPLGPEVESPRAECAPAPLALAADPPRLVWLGCAAGPDRSVHAAILAEGSWREARPALALPPGSEATATWDGEVPVVLTLSTNGARLHRGSSRGWTEQAP